MRRMGQFVPGPGGGPISVQESANYSRGIWPMYLNLSTQYNTKIGPTFKGERFWKV